MKKVILTALMITLLGVTASMADIKKGKSFYMKKLKSRMGNMNGMKFVSMHTADEWNELFEDDAEGFIQAFTQQFPKSSKVLASKGFKKRASDVRDFAVEFANDSGNVLSCGD